MWSRSSRVASPDTSPTVFPISSLSKLASAYSDAGDEDNQRRVLIWQVEGGELVAQDWTSHSLTRYKIRDSLDIFDEAKYSTPLAAAADSSGVIHLFYLNRSNAISHIYETSVGKWHRGKVTNKYGPILARGRTRLSATRHQNDADNGGSSILAILYQHPNGQLRLALSDAGSDATWHVVDISSLVEGPKPTVGTWDGLGHSIISSGVAISTDNNHTGYGTLILGVEGENGVLPWKCTIDAPLTSDKDTHCWWLNATIGGMWT